MKAFIVLFVLSLSFAAQAGEKGHGGISVVCRDQSGTIQSAELLDIYEGRILQRKDYPTGNLPAETYLQSAYGRLTDYPLYKQFIEHEIEKVKANFFPIQEDNELQLTDDALPLVIRKGCKFEQLATYTPEGQVLVSTEILNALSSKVDVAAFYLHEAIYAIKRKEGDQTSKRTRKLVAELHSLNPNPKAIHELLTGEIVLKPGLYRAKLTGKEVEVVIRHGEPTLDMQFITKTRHLLNFNKWTYHDEGIGVYVIQIEDFEKGTFKLVPQNPKDKGNYKLVISSSNDFALTYEEEGVPMTRKFKPVTSSRLAK